jgi:hypothetical protein
VQYRRIFISREKYFSRQTEEHMKITKKASALKGQICAGCKLKKACGDLPGFCMLIYYGLIALVVIMLGYFLISMTL